MKSPNIDKEYIFQKRKAIGAELQRAREQRSLSQVQLAELLGFEVKTIGRIEAGNFAYDIDVLLAFSVALEFDINLVLK